MNTQFVWHIMKSSRFYLLLLGVATVLYWASAPQTADSYGPLSASETVEVTENGLIVRWSAGAVSWGDAPFGMMPVIDQFSNDDRPGHSQLPVRTLIFAIPVGSTLRTATTFSSPEILDLAHPVAIAPQPAGVKTNAAGEIIGGDYVPISAIEPLDTAPPVAIEEIGTMNGIRLGKISFYPLTLVDDQMVLRAQATVEITFEHHPASQSGRLAETVQPSTALQQSIQAQVINPKQAVSAVQTGLKTRSATAVFAPVAVNAVLEVAEAGMVQLTYQHLIDHGIAPAQFNPNRLSVSHMGAEIPFRWMGDADDLFEADESLIFYAPPFKSRWTTRTPFLLSSTLAPSVQMLTRPGTPQNAATSGLATIKKVVEQNLFYAPDCLCGDLPVGWDGDRWVWAEMQRPGNLGTTIEASLSDVDTTQPAALTIHQIGFTQQEINLDHAVRVTLNGTTLGTVMWDGKSADSTTFNLPAGLLKDSNQIELELIDTGATIDGVWLDALEFEYARTNSKLATQALFFGEDTAESYTARVPQTANGAIYDVTDGTQPKRLDAPVQNADAISWDDEGQIDRVYALVPDGQYLEPVEIRSMAGLANMASGATYVMIVPREFANSADLQELKNHRESLGWQVAVETVEEIYAAFGAGEPSPDAIRNYLDWAYHSWAIRPEMVLLVGDGSVDPKLNRADSKATYIPPYLVQVDPWIGETAADNRFVTVDGSDALPDMAIGRLPANSLDELSVMISKILTYETEKPVGKWNQKMLIMADDNDQAGDFDVSSNHLSDQFLGSPWRPVKHYFGTHSTDISAAQDAVLQQWQGGLGLVMFTGHSSIHQWGAERFIHLDDVPALDNGDKLPLVLQMTCFTGSFHSAAFNTLDEQLLRQPGGGAIAVWGATGLGVASGHDSLAEAALQSIYTQQNPTLGVALLAGKVQLAANEPAHLDLLDTFNLLGDPALQINLDLTGEEIYLPVIFND